MRRSTTLVPVLMLALLATSCLEAKPPADQESRCQMLVDGNELDRNGRLDFGETILDQPVVRALEIRNGSATDWELALGALDNGALDTSEGFSFVDQNLGNGRVSLPANGSTLIHLQFMPRRPGLYEGSLTIVAPQDCQPSPIPLIGEALAGVDDGPKIDVQQTLDMGTIAVDTLKVKDLVITNGGNDNNRLRFVTIEGDISRAAPPVVYDAVDDVPSPYFGLAFYPGGSVFPGGFDPDLGLAAKEMVTLRLSYGSPTPGAHTGRLVIFTNDPATPVKTVTLEGTAVQHVSIPCVAVYDTPMNFGFVETNTSRTLRLTILNDQDPSADPDQFSCMLPGPRLTDGINSAFHIEDAGAEDIVVTPGGHVVISIVFTPTQEGPYAGNLTFYDPSPQHPSPVIPLSGFGTSSCLDVMPKALQFGTIGVGCQSTERTAALRNICANAIHLVGIPSVSSVTGTPFVIVNPPSTDYSMEGNSEYAMTVRYRPETLEQDDGVVTIPWKGGSTQKTESLSLVGTGQIDSHETENFQTPLQPKTDVLFVLDNSGSMYDKLEPFANNFDSFIAAAVAHGNDFHIAITTTDANNEMGRFVPVNGTQDQRILTTALSPAALKAQFVSNVLGVGTSGSSMEALIWPIYSALRDPLLSGANAGFLRQDARLSIIIVSDAGEQDPGTGTSSFETFLRTLKGPSALDNLRFSAIFPADPVACSYDTSTSAVMSLATALNGIVRDICAPDWPSALAELGELSFAPTQGLYLLLNDAIPDTIEIQIDGQPVPSVAPGPPYAQAWRYEAAARAIVFSEGWEPQAGQTLTVDYDTPCIAVTP